MKLYTALDKIKELNKSQLEHFIQLAQDDIDCYKIVIKNYDLDKMTKYGLPMLDRLNSNLEKFKSAYDAFRDF